jgi:hypothetical protein
MPPAGDIDQDAMDDLMQTVGSLKADLRARLRTRVVCKKVLRYRLKTPGCALTRR